MLFNSFEFLLAFLPVTAAGYFLLAKRSPIVAAGWLALASLFFYGWWNYRYIPLLLASITFNYWCGRCLSGSEDRVFKGRLLTFAVMANLLLLGYYKYANFFLSSASVTFGQSFQTLDIILPIGISFFTFTQIAFLVDAYQGKAKEYRFVHYVLFVTYFPHLIAGPVLHHKEMMPQFGDAETYRFSSSNFAVGLTILSIGLAKKVLIADNLAPYANGVFDSPDTPSFFTAWGGVLAYTFQLYFDFSGYSDMAIGLSRMFGVRLPLNFDSPYKAASIIEFWRRWHMTLSRFLKDYLYIAMGGNRLGPIRRYVNLFVTMLLGGLWHGAGWNFAIWGGLHGLFLIANHAWAAVARRYSLATDALTWRYLATLLTFVAVCFAWVFFRSSDLATAGKIIYGMTGGAGFALPEALVTRLGPFKTVLENIGVTVNIGGGGYFVGTWSWVLAAAFIAFLLPNTQQIVRLYGPALNYHPEVEAGIARRLVWRPTALWAFVLAILSVACLLSLNRPSEFLYFQF